MELRPVTDVPDIETFRHWDLCEEVQTAIEEMGIVKPTPIQALTTEHVLNRKDVIAKAETGTGKTLAFGAGMISKLDSDRSTVLGLILCPTRELASQVHDVMKLLGATRGIKTCLIVGGDPPQPQVKALQAGAQLVVGTPGRVMDLYNQGFLSFPWTEFVVLDEADEMLEIGFIDDIKKILSYTPDERTTLLFSATFPPALLRLAREYTTDPVEISTAKGVSTVDHITQSFIKVDEDEKWMTLVRLIENSDKEDVFLVFGDRRTDVDQLIRRMERMPFSTKALHGGYDQAARMRVMTAFRTGDVKCLVATDVASRGLDVKHVSHVVNFGVPRDVSIYTHRIGRTGRAGAKGNAITFVTYDNRGRWGDLERQMNWDVLEMPKPERGGRGGGSRGGRSDDRGGRGAREERGGRGREERGGRGREERGAREERRPRGDEQPKPEPRRREQPSRPPSEERERNERRPRTEEPARTERAPRREEQPKREPSRRPEGSPWSGKAEVGHQPGKIVRKSKKRLAAEAAAAAAGGEAPAEQPKGPAPTESAPRAERSEEQGERRPRRRRRSGGGGGEGRPERSESTGEGQASSEGGEDRKRGERGGRGRGRGRGGEGRSGERQERKPEGERPAGDAPRERRPRRDDSAQPSSEGGFGGGIASPERKPEPKPKTEAPKPQPKPEPKPQPKTDGGFGSGL